MRSVLVDAGPLIALFDKDDAHHAPMKELLRATAGRLITTWPVVTEVSHMLDFDPRAQPDFCHSVAAGGVVVHEVPQEALGRIIDLVECCGDRPMDRVGPAGVVTTAYSIRRAEAGPAAARTLSAPAESSWRRGRTSGLTATVQPARICMTQCPCGSAQRSMESPFADPGWHGPTARRSRKGWHVKVLISADLEGVYGMTGWVQVMPPEHDSGPSSTVEYECARARLTREVNAAFEGALAAGADEVIVNETHNGMRNLVPEDLHESIRFITRSDKAVAQVRAWLGERVVGVVVKEGYTTFSAIHLHPARASGRWPTSHATRWNSTPAAERSCGPAR